MPDENRKDIYAFLSRLFTDVLDETLLISLKSQPALLHTLGEESAKWIIESADQAILKALNVDFTSLFWVQLPPIESTIRDNSREIPVGLQNPVMSFYHRHGFEVNMNFTHLSAPDHLAIELGFMEALIKAGDTNAQRAFLSDHLLRWAPAYLLTQSRNATTPFYRDGCDFALEFLLSDYEQITQGVEQ